MVRSSSTRIRQELEALTLEWAAGRAESILHSQAGPTPFLWAGDTHWRKVRLRWSH